MLTKQPTLKEKLNQPVAENTPEKVEEKKDDQQDE